jgi:hypothetical protein
MFSYDRTSEESSSSKSGSGASESSDSPEDSSIRTSSSEDSLIYGVSSAHGKRSQMETIYEKYEPRQPLTRSSVVREMFQFLGEFLQRTRVHQILCLYMKFSSA